MDNKFTELIKPLTSSLKNADFLLLLSYKIFSPAKNYQTSIEIKRRTFCPPFSSCLYLFISTHNTNIVMDWHLQKHRKEHRNHFEVVGLVEIFCIYQIAVKNSIVIFAHKSFKRCIALVAR